MKRLMLMAAMLCPLAGTAEATPILYTLDSVDVDAHNSGSGLLIQTNALAFAPNFTLDDGESITFDVFQIYTNETSAELDDFLPRPIEVTFNFSSPTAENVVGGSTGAVTFFGLVTAGSVSFPDSAIFSTPLSTYEISLSEGLFNGGFGLNFTPGLAGAYTVSATITQISSVPEPSTVALTATGLGLVGLASLRRRRLARA